MHVVSSFSSDFLKALVHFHSSLLFFTSSCWPVIVAWRFKLQTVLERVSLHHEQRQGDCFGQSQLQGLDVWPHTDVYELRINHTVCVYVTFQDEHTHQYSTIRRDTMVMWPLTRCTGLGFGCGVSHFENYRKIQRELEQKSSWSTGMKPKLISYLLNILFKDFFLSSC